MRLAGRRRGRLPLTSGYWHPSIHLRDTPPRAAPPFPSQPAPPRQGMYQGAASMRPVSPQVHLPIFPPIATPSPSHAPRMPLRWVADPPHPTRRACSRRTAEGSLPSVEEVRRRTRRRSVDSSTAARELSPSAPATNYGRRRSLDLTGVRPLAKKAVSGGGGEARPAPPDDDDDKRKAVHTGGVSHAAQSVQDHRGDWRSDDAAAATAALSKGSAMRRMSDISPIRRSSLSQAPSDSMQAQGEGFDGDNGKPGSLRITRGMHRRASHDVSHRRATHDGSQRRTSLTASLLPSSLSARRVQPASAADEKKKPSFPPAKYQAMLLTAMCTVCTCYTLQHCCIRYRACHDMCTHTSSTKATPPLNQRLTPSLTPLYQAALFDLLFGTHGHAVNVASLYSVADEAGNTALMTAWQLVTCEDGQELIRQGDDKSEWCGLAAEAKTPRG
jgi:hypothetical protein